MASGKMFKRTKVVNSGDHNPSQCSHMLHGKLIHYKPKKATEGKELVTLYDNDGDRKLIVPNRNSIDIPAILPKSEFDRLKKQAHVVTKQVRIEMMEQADAEKNKLLVESLQRKEALRKAQQHQVPKQGSKLGKIENEAADKSQYLLQRAFELRQEQEEEVKKVNSLILATKCMAIREAQIAERELIQRELDEEERRLDMMMEQQRQKAIKQEEDKQQLEAEKTQRYVNQIMQQMKENNLQRLLEAERIEEERRLANKAALVMQKEDEERERQKHLGKLRMQEEMKQANDNLERYKLLRQQEDKIADIRIQEFMRKKAEREGARESELNAIKAAKEREISRLRTYQKKALDQKAMTDELNARRIAEETEKDWREKQKLAAIKRKEQAAEMRDGRERQIDEIRRAQALELARDEEEFHQVAKVQRELFEKDKEKKVKKREEAMLHRKELLKQINQKERDRINMFQKKYSEGEAQRLEQELRALRIKETVHKKIQNLRENNVPENYINDIQRQTT